MHQRKALMARRADAFLTLPGGIGTFEEFFETLSWAALKLHHKPMGVLNVAGYFDPLLALLDHAVAERFVRRSSSTSSSSRPIPRRSSRSWPNGRQTAALGRRSISSSSSELARRRNRSRHTQRDN